MDNMKIKFELEDVDGKHTSEFIVDDIESWHELTLMFADFLSARYGYPIKSGILFVTDYPFGRIKDQYITINEAELVMKHRTRQNALDSLFKDEQ